MRRGMRVLGAGVVFAAAAAAGAQAPGAGQAGSGTGGASAGQAPGTIQARPPLVFGNHHMPAKMRPLQPPVGGAAGNAAGNVAGAAGARKAASPTEDALARLVKGAGVIFAGEVYAIRMPAGEGNKGTRGGAPSARTDAVDVEFRVDQGVRGAGVGSPFTLHQAVGEFRAQNLFGLHLRAVVFLRRPDAAGLSGPVEGAAGVLPISVGNQEGNQVDLSRLHALAGTASAAPVQAGGAPAGAGNGVAAPAGAGAAPAPAAVEVTDVTGAAGEQTLIAGTDHGEMPELDAAQIPYLALIRDVYVLAAAEGNGNDGGLGGQRQRPVSEPEHPVLQAPRF